MNRYEPRRIEKYLLAVVCPLVVRVYISAVWPRWTLFVHQVSQYSKAGRSGTPHVDCAPSVIPKSSSLALCIEPCTETPTSSHQARSSYAITSGTAKSMMQLRRREMHAEHNSRGRFDGAHRALARVNPPAVVATRCGSIHAVSPVTVSQNHHSALGTAELSG